MKRDGCLTALFREPDLQGNTGILYPKWPKIHLLNFTGTMLQDSQDGYLPLIRLHQHPPWTLWSISLKCFHWLPSSASGTNWLDFTEMHPLLCSLPHRALFTCRAATGPSSQLCPQRLTPQSIIAEQMRWDLNQRHLFWLKPLFLSYV